MNQKEIEASILRALYEDYFLADGHLDVEELCNKEAWDVTLCSRVLRNLRNKDYIISQSIRSCALTAKGVVFCEERNIAPEELSTQNNKIRRLTLECLDKAYEEEALDGAMYYTDLSEKAGLDQDSMMPNVHILVALSYVERLPAAGHYKIADRGISALRDWANRGSRVRLDLLTCDAFNIGRDQGRRVSSPRPFLLLRPMPLPFSASPGAKVPPRSGLPARTIRS